MKEIEIPFGAKDSELKGWEYTIPEGMEAEIKDGKIVVREKESEDERILNGLIAAVKDQISCGGEFYFGMPLKDILAYLEKQKVIAAIPDELVECYKNLCERGNREVALLINAINGNEQKEQKPEERFEEAREKYQVEWSEEDEKMIRSILFVLESYVSKAECEQSPALTATYPTYYKEIDWLKSLRPSWKPSEQEKGALRTAIHILTDERSFPKAAAQLQNILDAFEGKESRKDWKPSEEQMNGFHTVLYQPQYISNSDDERLKQAESLYKDLKKLM